MPFVPNQLRSFLEKGNLRLRKYMLSVFEMAVVFGECNSKEVVVPPRGWSSREICTGQKGVSYSVTTRGFTIQANGLTGR